MDPRQITMTRDILQGVLLIVKATGQPAEQLLDLVLSDVPKRPPTPSKSMRAPLELCKGRGAA